MSHPRSAVKEPRRTAENYGAFRKQCCGCLTWNQAKSAVLNTLSSIGAQRGHRHAIEEFIEWYCSEPRLLFSNTVVLPYRIHPRISASGARHDQPLARRGTRPRVDSMEGLWQGFDGEWGHVSRQLIALAETIPEEKYSWRPSAGVRSTSEVLMHVAITNFFLLSVTGPPMPSDLTSGKLEQSVTRKADVISWLRRSLEAVKAGRANLKAGELGRSVKIEGRDATVDGMYLRIIVHANEHMGQLVAYARVNGIAPPW